MPSGRRLSGWRPHGLTRPVPWDCPLCPAHLPLAPLSPEPGPEREGLVVQVLAGAQGGDSRGPLRALGRVLDGSSVPRHTRPGPRCPWGKAQVVGDCRAIHCHAAEVPSPLCPCPPALGQRGPREVEAEGPRGPPRQLTSTWPGVHGGPSLSAGAASPREPRARSCWLALPVG